jgi:hypothetical protein
MPILSNYENRKKVSFSNYVRRVEEVAQKRKAKHTTPQTVGTLFAKRNKRIAIAESSARGVDAVITYVKIGDSANGKNLQDKADNQIATYHSVDLKKYAIVPLEWKMRKLKMGYRKVLWAQDIYDNFRTKSFVASNIQKVAIGNRRIKPKFGFTVRINSTRP